MSEEETEGAYVETPFDEEKVKKVVDVKDSTKVFEKIVDEYLERVKEIREAHARGTEEPTIGDLISDGKRKEGETYEVYKMRRKAENLILKHYRRGVRGR